MVMIHNNTILYTNKSMVKLLQYANEEFYFYV